MVNEKEKADLILADPPYNLDIEKWDSGFDFEEMIKVFSESLKPSGSILIFNTFTNVIKISEIAKKFGLIAQTELPLIWVKTNPHPKHMRKNSYTENDKECILWLSRTKNPSYSLETSEPFHNGIFYYSSGNSTQHRCEKPKGLIDDLILKHSRPNSLVFDPFMGSGAVVKACNTWRRRAVAWELDKHWFEKIEL